MNTGAGGCSLLIMGALAVILGGLFGFIGIFIAIAIAIAVVGAIVSAFGEEGEDE